MAAHRLQESLDNVTVQYKLEKASSQAKDNRIKSLEDLIIKMGHDPTNIKAAEKLIKKKNEDIAALKKQLSLPIYNTHKQKRSWRAKPIMKR